MKKRSRNISRLLTVCLAVMVALVFFTEPVMSQFSIGGGRNKSGISIDPMQAFRTVRSATEARQGFTYAQAFYLGRAIAANILTEYKLYSDPTANRYVTLVGQTVAAHSDMPQTYGGYFFFILDSDEVNAFAAPGGIIFITRGMLKACENEDQLAAVLAHEVAHIQSRHGVGLIKDSRWKKFGTDAVFLAASGYGGGDVAAAVGVFGDMVKDVSNEIMTRGYGKKLEKEADTEALTILMRIGYEPHESATLMQNMEEQFIKGGKDFAKTHPKPKDRIKTIDKALKREPVAAEVPSVRVTRFDAALSAARAQ